MIALIDRLAVLRLLARCRVQGLYSITVTDPLAVLIEAVEALPIVHVRETARVGDVPAAPIESVKKRVIPITQGGRP